MRDLADIQILNRFTTELVTDELTLDEAGSRQVFGAFSSIVHPTPVVSPTLMGWSSNLATSLNITKPAQHSDGLNLLVGNTVRPGMRPYSMCYGGHQFGHWAGQLGDGRAIALGEIVGSDGTQWDLQLKGAGPTPYSRTADGRAVVRSSVREFIASEAMYGLGVPTTRALAVIDTGESVVRDMFYNGNACAEPGAITVRMAPTFLRFGNFEILAAREEHILLRKLLLWSIEQWFPTAADRLKPLMAGQTRSTEEENEAIAEFFACVCRDTAFMVSEWQRVGFVHGVMNTDNMSILGLTIDYGPFGWLDSFDPTWTPNTTDLPGRRYCFDNQPSVARWNLERFAEALSVLGISEHVLMQGLNAFDNRFVASTRQMWSKRLGIRDVSFESDSELFSSLNALFRSNEIDMTLFFRGLSEVSLSNEMPVSNGLPSRIQRSIYDKTRTAEVAAEISAWLDLYRVTAQRDLWEEPLRIAVMNSTNPTIVPRNFQLHKVIDLCYEGDYSSLQSLYEALLTPYDDVPLTAKWDEARPEWARSKPGCSMLSCSS